MYARRGDLRRYFRRRGQRRVEETSVQNRLLKPKLNAAPLQQMREREQTKLRCKKISRPTAYRWNGGCFDWPFSARHVDVTEESPPRKAAAVSKLPSTKGI